MNRYMTMLFVDFSSAFNTISPMELTGKLNTLGLSITLCNCILDFLTSRAQRVWTDTQTSSPLVLNPGAPQGSVLSPLLFTLHSQTSRECDCKYMDNKKRSYWEEINSLAEQHTESHLLLSVSRTKELIVSTDTLFFNHGTEVEQVNS